MKWKRESIWGRLKRVENWHSWFAWYPVRYENILRDPQDTIAWLETVERRRIYGRMASWWEYRPHGVDTRRRDNDTQ